MENEEKKVEETQPKDDVLDMIKKLKTELNQTQKELESQKETNSKLISGYLNDSPSDGLYTETDNTEVIPTQKELDDTINELVNGNNTNLEYATKALFYRNGMIARHNIDPFMAQGHKANRNDPFDKECADRVATVLQECIDYANGDSEVFTQEVLRRMDDSSPFLRR